MRKTLKGSGGGGPSYTKDNLLSYDRGEMLLGIAEGPIQGIKDNSLKNLYINGTPVLNEVGEDNFELDDLYIAYNTGGFDHAAWTPQLGGLAQFHAVNVAMTDQDVEFVRQVPSALSGTYDRVDLNFNITQLYKSDDDGTKNSSITLDIYWRVPTHKQYNDWQQYGSKSLVWSGKTTSGYSTQVTLRDLKELVTEGLVLELKVVRRSAASNDETRREITWEGYETINTGVQSNYEGTAQLHFYANASEQLEGALEVSAIWRGLMVPIPTNYNPETREYDESTPWDGSFTTERYWTDNPIWLTLEMIRNTRFGLAASNKHIRVNAFSWYEYAKYCDEMVSNGVGGLQPRFTLNLALTEIGDGLDQINYLLGSCFAVAVDDGSGMLTLYADYPVSATHLITPEMCEASAEGVTFNYEYTDVYTRPNQIRAEFIDPNKDYEADFVTVTHQESIDRIGLVLEETSLHGCQNSHEATRKAMMRLVSGQTERMVANFTLVRQGMYLEPFQIILVADPSRSWGLTGRAAVNGTQLELTREIYIEQATTYVLRLSTPAGTLERQIALNVGYHKRLTLDDPIDQDLPDTIGFSLEDADGIGVPKPFRVMRVDETGTSGLTWAVTAIEVNRDKWVASDNAEYMEIPDYSYTRPVAKPTPTDLKVVLENEKFENQTRRLLSMQWVAPEGQSNVEYSVWVNANGGGYQEVGRTRDRQFEHRYVDYGSYQVQVLGHAAYGTGESEVTWIDVNAVTSEDWLLDPANLVIDVETAWAGSDLLLEVKAKFYNDGWPVDLVAENRIGGYQFRVATPDGEKIHRTSSANLTYRYAEMVEDFGGAPPSDMTITLDILDYQYVIGGSKVIQILDDGGTPRMTEMRVNFRDTTLDAIPLWDQSGVEEAVSWYLGETSDFAAAQLVSHGVTLNQSGLRDATTYYFWAVYQPTFGTAQRFPENGYEITTLSTSDLIVPGLTGKVSKELLSDDTLEYIESIQPDMSGVYEAIEGVEADIAQVESGLRTEFETKDRELSSNLARVEQSVATETEARTTAIETLKTNVETEDAKLSTDIGTLSQALTTETETRASEIRHLQTSFENADGELQAGINSNKTAISDAAQSIAGILTKLNASAGDSYAAIQEAMAVAANVDGKYEAQWAIKTDVAGIKGGVGFYNNGYTTQFMVTAESFVVKPLEGTDVLPVFTVVDGVTSIDKSYINELEAVTIYSATMYATEMVAPRIYAGHIQASTLEFVSDDAIPERLDNNNVTTDSIGAETPQGAQAKANQAQQNAESYTESYGTANFVSATQYAADLADIQNQIDNSVTTWFQTGLPTLSNYPASEWATTTVRDTHLGDLYYDNATGYSYRFHKTGSTYSWVKLSDSDVTKALEAAAKAQDTADGKRRVFVATPVAPYDVGDLWDTGSGLKRCKTASTTPYNSAHWVLSTDAAGAAAAAEAAAKAHAEAKATAAETRAKAYADGEITASEQRAIDYADQAAIDAETAAIVAANAYADGEVTASEQRTLNHANAVATASEVRAKAYADGVADAAELAAIAAAEAKADLAEVNAKAYADGEVSDAEARAIAEAQKKADAAKNAAISTAATDATNKANNAKSQAISSAASDATTKANAAKSHAETKATEAKNAAISTAATDATTKANNAKAAAISAAATDATTKANNAKAQAIASAKTASETFTNTVKQSLIDNEISDAESAAIAEAGRLALAAAKEATAKVNEAIMASGGSLFTNSTFALLAADGRPSGAYAAYGSAVSSNIKWNATHKALEIYKGGSDKSLGCSFAAMRTDGSQKYRIVFKVKCAANTSSGFYFRINELDSQLPDGKKFLSNSVFENGGVASSRTLSTFRENAAVTTSWVTLEYVYTPTASAKWFSPMILAWDGLGSNSLYFKDLIISPISTAEADALAAAKEYTNTVKQALIDGEISQAEANAIAEAKAKADAAKAAAISAAATDATTKANNAKSQAISSAATDATTKANNAKSQAISSAATDATNKANNAKSQAISAAATDATNKANAAQKYADQQLVPVKDTLENNHYPNQDKLQIKSSGYSPGKSGWAIDVDGNVEFNNGVFRGTLEGVDGYFSGTVKAERIEGDIISGIVKKLPRTMMKGTSSERYNYFFTITIKDSVPYARTLSIETPIQFITNPGSSLECKLYLRALTSGYSHYLGGVNIVSSGYGTLDKGTVYSMSTIIPAYRRATTYTFCVYMYSSNGYIESLSLNDEVFVKLYKNSNSME